MYALARNSWKFHNRDKRINKIQNIEFETFAPDTIEEIINARKLLEVWTAKAYLNQNDSGIKDQNELIQLGRKLLYGNIIGMNGLEVLGENMENTKRKVVILKPYEAYHAYGNMLHHYAIKNLLAYIDSHNNTSLSSMHNDLNGKHQQEWINLGGQIMLQKDLDKLRSDIGSGKLNSWQDIHKRYDKLWVKYQADKQKHSYSIICELTGKERLSASQWKSALDKAVEIQEYICDQVYISRKKDYDNPYRLTTFRNNDEMKAAIGSVDENSFILQVRKETEDLKKLIRRVKSMN